MANAEMLADRSAVGALFRVRSVFELQAVTGDGGGGKLLLAAQVSATAKMPDESRPPLTSHATGR